MYSLTIAYNNTHCAVELQNIYPFHYPPIIVIASCSVFMYISAEVTKQLFFVVATIKMGCCTTTPAVLF